MNLKFTIYFSKNKANEVCLLEVFKTFKWAKKALALLENNQEFEGIREIKTKSINKQKKNNIIGQDNNF